MIRVITGPPASGKTTYVRENAQPGDFIIDMDHLAEAMWMRNTAELHDYPDELRMMARRARKAAVNAAIEIAQVSNRVNLWIIDTAPSQLMLERYKTVNAKIIELDPGKDEVLTRLRKRNPRTFNRLRLVVNEWYQSKR